MLDSLCSRLYQLLQGFIFDVVRCPFGHLVAGEVARKLHADGGGRLLLCLESQFVVHPCVQWCSHDRGAIGNSRGIKERRGTVTVRCAIIAGVE